MLNLVPQTERYLFDVSNIPVGDIFPLESATGQSTPDSHELLRRNLFADPTTFCPDIPDIPGTNSRITDSTNIVTVMTAPTAATTLFPCPPLDPPPAVAAAAEHDPPPANTTNKPSSRKRFSYRKKYFYANSAIYLELNNDHPHPGEGESSSLPDLVGYVEVCPQKRNGQMYHIRWTSLRSGAAWPDNLRHHLRNKFEKGFLHPLLKKLIEACPLNDSTPGNVSAAGTTTGTI
jgi:hypothetical protein